MAYYVDPVRLESDQKDLLISELKAENFELRNKERHYNEMYDTINIVENDCASLHQEKRSMEEDMRRRSDADGVNIRRLREQNEALVLANRDFDAKLAHIRDEIAHVRSINDSKAREIADLHNGIAIRDGDNAGLRSQIGGAQAAIDGTVANIGRTNGITDDLNRSISARTLEIGDKNAAIAAAEADMARLRDNHAKARVDQDKLRCRLDDEIDRNNRFTRDNGDMVSKGISLMTNIKDLEGKCSARDAQISGLRAEVDRVKHALGSGEN